MAAVVTRRAWGVAAALAVLATGGCAPADPAVGAEAGQEAEVGPPVETGQSAFAALAEVVAQLEADPSTDWSQVDLEALRSHLVDMDEVTLRAEVTARDIDGGAEFMLNGPARTQAALHRMAPAHAGATASDPRYAMRVGPGTEGGVRVTITVKDPADAEGVERIRALGFVGMLVRGMHHGPHHLAIARGGDPHGGHDHAHGHD